MPIYMYKGLSDDMEAMLEHTGESEEIGGNGETTAGIDSLRQALSCIFT